jgi:hypothetical protein
VADCTGLENRSTFATHHFANLDDANTSGNKANGPADNMAFCLAFLAQKSPDLALLVERWEELPEAVRAGMVAMVKAAGATPRPQPRRPNGTPRLRLTRPGGGGWPDGGGARFQRPAVRWIARRQASYCSASTSRGAGWKWRVNSLIGSSLETQAGRTAHSLLVTPPSHGLASPCLKFADRQANLACKENRRDSLANGIALAETLWQKTA